MELTNALILWSRPDRNAPIQWMHPLELLAAREALGLTREALAEALEVRPSLVRTWERGQSRIGLDVRRKLEHLEAYTDLVAATLAAEMAVNSDPWIPAAAAYWQDDDLPPVPLPDAPLTPTARWWRVVAHRATRRVHGARITAAPIKET